jgi:hypothetical protein
MTTQNGACALRAVQLRLKKSQAEYVIVIVFRRQQWLHERAWILRNTYTACIIIIHDLPRNLHVS